MKAPVLPSRPLDSKKFKYVPAAHTDIRKTIEKFRRLIRMQQRIAA